MPQCGPLIYCERGFSNNIKIVSLNKNTYLYDFRKTDLIVDGGSPELTTFLFNQLKNVSKLRALLCGVEKTGVRINRKGEVNINDIYISETSKPGFVPFLYKMTKKKNIIKYADSSCFKGSKDHDKYRIVVGYLPNGKSHSLSIGLTTIIEPGIYLPDSPNRYFVAENKDHAINLNNYIHSGPIEKFILQTTRKNKTLDALTENGVTKFVPNLPPNIKIETDEDVFNFLNTPLHIREKIRADYRD